MAFQLYLELHYLFNTKYNKSCIHLMEFMEILSAGQQQCKNPSQKRLLDELQAVSKNDGFLGFKRTYFFELTRELSIAADEYDQFSYDYTSQNAATSPRTLPNTNYPQELQKTTDENEPESIIIDNETDSEYPLSMDLE